MCRQAKLQTERQGPTYKFGILLPTDRNHAFRIDKDNDDHLWDTSLGTEVDQIAEYNTYRNVGRGAKPPRDHQRIRVHFVFDVKHDLRRKSRLVAGGHMTSPPNDSIYSGVVTLRSLRLCMFLGKLNGLDVDAADVGNAFLMAYTKEKLFIIAGPEFGDLQGCLLIIVKTLYGLRTSRARWYELFADTLMDMGFYPCKADPDVWMKDLGTHYGFVCVYVDDLACIWPILTFSSKNSDVEATSSRELGRSPIILVVTSSGILTALLHGEPRRTSNRLLTNVNLSPWAFACDVTSTVCHFLATYQTLPFLARTAFTS
jgi:hypothetical protein